MQMRVATTADTVRPAMWDSQPSLLSLSLSLTCVPQWGGEYFYRLNPHDEPTNIAGCLGGHRQANQEAAVPVVLHHEDADEEREGGQHHAGNVHPSPAELVWIMEGYLVVSPAS